MKLPTFNNARGSQVAAKTQKQNPLARMYRDTKSELKKVAWPSREETFKLTVVVIAISLATGVVLGIIDYLVSQLYLLLSGIGA